MAFDTTDLPTQAARAVPPPGAGWPLPFNENWLVSIGNSDDPHGKLTQLAWSLFIAETVAIIDTFRVRWHGRWYSSPTDPWQNANFCFQLPDLPTLAAYMAHAHDLESQLARTAARFAQESIAVTRGPVRFVRATPGLAPRVVPMPEGYLLYGTDRQSSGTR